jgi:hypothetical protein
VNSLYSPWNCKKIYFFWFSPRLCLLLRAQHSLPYNKLFLVQHYELAYCLINVYYALSNFLIYYILPLFKFIFMLETRQLNLPKLIQSLRLVSPSHCHIHWYCHVLEWLSTRFRIGDWIYFHRFSYNWLTSNLSVITYQLGPHRKHRCEVVTRQ